MQKIETNMLKHMMGLPKKKKKKKKKYLKRLKNHFYGTVDLFQLSRRFQRLSK